MRRGERAPGACECASGQRSRPLAQGRHAVRGIIGDPPKDDGLLHRDVEFPVLMEAFTMHGALLTSWTRAMDLALSVRVGLSL